MPKKSYQLIPGEPERLEVSWSGFWKNLTLKIGNKEIGVIPNSKELKKGRAFDLEDGSTLEIKLVTGFANSGLDVKRNGQSISGSLNDPAQILKTSYGIIYFLAILNIVLGTLGEIYKSKIFEMMGADIYMAFVGLFFGVMGYLVKKKSTVALIITILILTVDLIMQIYLTGKTNGLVIRILFIVGIARGYKAIKELKNRDDDIFSKADVFN